MTMTMVSMAGLMGLGAFHGLNPGMGWLFAVALGVQEGGRQAVWRALAPLAVGHALAIAVAVAAVQVTGTIVPDAWLTTTVGGLLVVLGASRLRRHRHPRWASMRVGAGRLTWWSFLMASAHGAGLMVLPLMLDAPAVVAAAHCHTTAAPSTWSAALVGTLAHSAGYLAITGALAVAVYEKVGVGILRTAWVNLDALWAIALIVTGTVTLVS